MYILIALETCKMCVHLEPLFRLYIHKCTRNKGTNKPTITDELLYFFKKTGACMWCGLELQMAGFNHVHVKGQ